MDKKEFLVSDAIAHLSQALDRIYDLKFTDFPKFSDLNVFTIQSEISKLINHWYTLKINLNAKNTI